MSIVILAEKPSQGRAYAEAFKNTSRKDGYIEVNDNRFFNGKAFITWGFGHLVELVEPEKYNKEWKEWSLDALPILPKQFRFQVGKGKQKQFNVVKKLLNSATEIIVATDSDREGENIARSIMQLAGVSSKPTKRLWINSLEVDEIQKGFRDLKNGNDYMSLYTEAQTRQFSDWLVGMNASRLYTLLLQQKGLRGVYSCGRVQTPSLYLIYKRQKEIENFVSKPFYELLGDVSTENGKFNTKLKGKYDSQNEVSELLSKHNVQLGENSGVIKKVEKKSKKTKSTKLHSLSTLQTKANKKWKYSPSDVLKIVQGLYEKKLVSYPRTDTQFITDSEFQYLKDNLSKYQDCLGVNFEVAYPNARKRFVDGSKVQEHYAIIPTKQVANMDRLTEKEKNIYQEIMSVTMAMFMDDYQYEETNVRIDVKGLLFEAKGKVEKNKGWKELFAGEDKKDKDEIVLPVMREGEPCSVKIKTHEGMTKPPKAYTEGGLINVMKNAGRDVEDDSAKQILKKTEGIGTEATRASIIETLKHQKYIEVKKNVVSVTKKGEILCKAVDGTLLSSPEMTAKWEEYLAKIGKGNGSQEAFIHNINKFIEHLMNEAPKAIDKMENVISESKNESAVGKCPKCDGMIVYKGKFYGCSGYGDGCKFTLPKKWAGKDLTNNQIKMLLKKGKTNLIKGFESKKGKKFDAHLVLKDGKLKMEFRE